jgi:hypothetical protein
MVATRAMAAKKAPNSTDDKENDNQLALRKKPVRRATAKSNTTSTKSSATTTTTKAPIATAPAKPSSTATSAKASTPAPAARPKRQTRAAVTAPPPEPAPTRAPNTRRKPALPEVARGKALRSRKVDPEPEQEPEPQPEVEEPEEVEQVVSPPPTKAKTTRFKKAEKAPEPEAEQESDQELEAESEPVPDPEANLEVSEEEVEHDSKVKQSQTPNPREPEQEQESEQEIQEEEYDEDEENGSSEDEICGPKTPMRRTTRSQAAPRTAASSKTARRLQTPARRLLSHRTDQGTPQTQRMPQNAARNSSPPRPMTVARGAEKPMVFRPLKHQTPRQIFVPAAANHQSNIDMTEEELPENSETELEESSADELDDQLRTLQDEDIIIKPTPAHTIQFEAVSSDSEDELAGAGRDLEEDDDELDEDTVVEIDEKKEPEYLPAQLDAEDDISDESESTADDSDLDDSILPEPQFSADFTTSVPSSPASVAAEPPQIEIDDSELLSSPAPSTPGSVIQCDLDSPTQQIAPTSRLSIDDNDLLSLMEDDATTPNVKPRVSFSTATAKMLKTPRMQFALGTPLRSMRAPL